MTCDERENVMHSHKSCHFSDESDVQSIVSFRLTQSKHRNNNNTHHHPNIIFSLAHFHKISPHHIPPIFY